MIEPKRIEGYDLARAQALLGMVFINFWVLTDEYCSIPLWLESILRPIEGRAAATFVVLAGIGLSLLSRNAFQNRHDVRQLNETRQKILNRAVFLLIIGLLNNMIWPEDILHFYAAYLVMSIYIFQVSNKSLVYMAFVPIIIFASLTFSLDFERGDDWRYLSFDTIWNISGMTRHMLYEGLFPIFPWYTFLLAGFWLGRQDLSNIARRKQILIIGMGSVIFSELGSRVLTHFDSVEFCGIDMGALYPLFLIDPWEPEPFFVTSALGTAITFIILSNIIAEKYNRSSFFIPFFAVGRTTLTLYIAHIILGKYVIEALRRFDVEINLFPLWGSLVFFIMALFISYYFEKRLQKGPLERLMRKFSLPMFFYKSMFLKLQIFARLRRFEMFNGKRRNFL